MYLHWFTLCVTFFSGLISICSADWDGNIVFSDEFSGTKLDRSKWNVELGCSPRKSNCQLFSEDLNNTRVLLWTLEYGAGDLECYVDNKENIYIKDGKLVIKAIPKGNGNYTSGRIRQKSGFTYGAYVARIKLPDGKHLWPAFWMLQTDEGNGCLHEEIDIVEYRGQEKNTAEYTAYVGRNWEHHNMKSITSKPVNDFSKDFHEFAVLWTPEKLQWYVDGDLQYELPTNWETWTDDVPSNKRPCRRQELFADPFQIILNMAVGGSFFPPNQYPPLMDSEARRWLKPTMEVDWVRIYQS